MQEPILKSVANPPRLFWAPFLPAFANFGMQVPFMFIGLGLWQMNPLLFVPSVVGIHLVLIAYGAREPHLSTMMKAQGPLMSPSRNVIRVKGNKLSP